MVRLGDGGIVLFLVQSWCDSLPLLCPAVGDPAAGDVGDEGGTIMRKRRRWMALAAVLILCVTMAFGGGHMARPVTSRAASPGIQMNALTFGNMEGYRMMIVELVATEDYPLEAFGGIFTWECMNGGPADELHLASEDYFTPNLPSCELQGSEDFNNAEHYHFANVYSTAGPTQIHAGDVLARWALETDSGKLNCEIAYIFRYEVEWSVQETVNYTPIDSWGTGTQRAIGYTVEHMWKWDETVSPGTTHVGFTWNGPENNYETATAHYVCISCGQPYPLPGCIIKRSDTLPEVGKAGNIHFHTWVDEIVSPDGLYHDGFLDVPLAALDPPPETAPPETAPPETAPTEPGETKPTEPGETKATEPAETKPTEPGETKPTEPGETKPTEPGTTEAESMTAPGEPEDGGGPGGGLKKLLGLSKGGGWALINLIAMIVTVIFGLGMLETLFVGGVKVKRRKGESREDFAERKRETKRRNPTPYGKLLGVLPAAFSVWVFLVTEDMRQKMMLRDRYTILMLVILAVAMVLALLTKRRTRKEKKREEES